MKTGEMPSMSVDMKVNADKKKVIDVNSPEMMLQSNSRSRGGRMDLMGGKVDPKDQCC
jgi:hypothetical protein